jgi:hypothetical protein
MNIRPWRLLVGIRKLMTTQNKKDYGNHQESISQSAS